MKPTIYNTTHWGESSADGFGAVYHNLKPDDK